MKLKSGLFSILLGASLLSCNSERENINPSNYIFNVSSMNDSLNQINGFENLINLNKNSLTKEQIEKAEKIVPYFTMGNYVRKNLEEFLLDKKKYTKYKEPASLKLKNKKELMEVVKDLHEISYYHYALSKNRNVSINIKGKEIQEFPNYLCGESTKNIVMSAFHTGYLNTVLAHDNIDGHAYAIIPFVLNDKRGIIVADPTSDQLFNDESKKIPNNVFVMSVNGEYTTDWANGKNLYPTSIESLNYLKFQDYSYSRSTPINDFLKKAYKNTVSLSKLPLKH